ncbi:hypothetical protein [Saccharopolyspora gregorii]|uniref:Uncharacterized protein n=1 Tax=Saccharopolyspora gregorii TaxID=33914 RepID=A0ABP6RHJ4_9PSEU
MHTEVRATAARPPSTTAGPPAFARRPLLLVAAAFAVGPPRGGGVRRVLDRRGVHAGRGPVPPDWGYVDQPPLAPLLAGAMGWLAPGSMIVLRLPAVLISAGGVLLAGSLGAGVRR